jgi:hypothetical protein
VAWRGLARRGAVSPGAARQGMEFNQEGSMSMARAARALKVVAEDQTTPGANELIARSEPYTVTVGIEGSADLLWHRWNPEHVEGKAKAAKGSAGKKTDDIETYVYRDDHGFICLPGEYLRQSIIAAAKFKQDPRSPRKSALDLHKAAVQSLTLLASLGTKQWDYEDRRRAVVQRNGINRTRPAMRVGWKCSVDLLVTLPEYIPPQELNDTIAAAGRLIGVGDFRPTYGRFVITSFGVHD